jgi:hypothetical protein
MAAEREGRDDYLFFTICNLDNAAAAVRVERARSEQHLCSRNLDFRPWLAARYSAF